MTDKNLIKLQNVPGKQLVILQTNSDEIEKLIENYIINHNPLVGTFVFARANGHKLSQKIQKLNGIEGEFAFVYNGKNEKKVKYYLAKLEAD